MHAPPDTTAIRLLFWLLNTPGVGGAAVMGIAGTCALCCVATLRCIARGSKTGETATYSYPTSTLLEHR